MVGFAGCQINMQKAYEITTKESIWLVLTYSLAYIPFNFPSNYLMDKYGLWSPTIISVLCNIIGAWIRIISSGPSYGFYWIILG